jgi:hypothetical protein
MKMSNTITSDFIINELRKVTQIKTTRNSVSIICPFHIDSDPSLSVSLGGKVSPGVFHCFSCNASGHWNHLAEKLGLTTVENGVSHNTHLLSPNTELFSLIEEENLVLEDLDFQWRGFPKKLMKKLEVQKLWEERLDDYYLYLPVTMIGDYYGHIRAKINKDSPGVKYWFNLKSKIFYPFDYILEKNTSLVVLVEGIADFFRLIKNKIPTLATLGTNFPYDAAYEYLENLAIDKVILCFDGDDAGDKVVFGSDKKGSFAEYLTDKGMEVRFLRPPNGKDPDNMPFYYIQVLKHMIKKMGERTLLSW